MRPSDAQQAAIDAFVQWAKAPKPEFLKQRNPWTKNTGRVRLKIGDHPLRVVFNAAVYSDVLFLYGFTVFSDHDYDAADTRLDQYRESVDQWGLPITSDPDHSLEEAEEAPKREVLYHWTSKKAAEEIHRTKTLKPSKPNDRDVVGVYLTDLDNPEDVTRVLGSDISTEVCIPVPIESLDLSRAAKPQLYNGEILSGERYAMNSLKSVHEIVYLDEIKLDGVPVTSDPDQSLELDDDMKPSNVEAEKKKAETRRMVKGAKGDWKAEGYTLHHEPADHEAGNYDRIVARDKSGAEAGYLSYRDHETEPGALEAAYVNVHEAHAGKGLATAMYQYAEKLERTKFAPSTTQNDSGKALWAQPKRPFGESVDQWGLPVLEEGVSLTDLFDKYFLDQELIWKLADRLKRQSHRWYERVGAESEDDPELDQKIESALRNRIDGFFQSLQSAEQSNGKITLFRCISVKDVGQFVDALSSGKYINGYDGLGVFWSWDENAADCHWGSGREYVIIKCETEIQNIDVPSTFNANMDLGSGEEEQEITLKKGAKVKVLGIQYSNGKDISIEPVTLNASFDQWGLPVLEEGISSIVYHKTGRAFEILTENQFKLTFANSADAAGKPDGKWFYLSTARSPLGKYYHNQTLVLDGRKLAERYSGGPMDYWGPEFRRISPTNAEMEDRIWSREQIIPDAKSYILEAHVFLQEPERRAEIYRTIALECKKSGIPVFFYDDPAAYQILNTAKTVKPDFTIKDPQDDKEFERVPGVTRKFGAKMPRDRYSSYVDALISLYYMKDLKQLEKEKYNSQIVRALRNIQGIDRGSGVLADIQNNKTKSVMSSLAEVMRDGGFKKIEELFDFIRKKFEGVRV